MTSFEIEFDGYTLRGEAEIRKGMRGDGYLTPDDPDYLNFGNLEKVTWAESDELDPPPVAYHPQDLKYNEIEEIFAHLAD
jgi:hypothetical protein